MPDPRGDRRDGRFASAPGDTLETLAHGLREQGRRTREALAGRDPADVGAPGPGWDGAALPPGVGLLGSLVDAGERIGGAVLR